MLQRTVEARSATDRETTAAFTQFKGALRRFLSRHTGDTELVDDVLQDVFVKMLTTVRNDRVIDNLQGWLFTAARTTLADHFRKNGHIASELDENIALDEGEDWNAHRALTTCLLPFVDHLPEPYRSTLLATDLGEDTMQSLAKRQGLSVSAIKSRAARGRQMVRKRLKACCDVETGDGRVQDFSRRPGGSCGCDSR